MTQEDILEIEKRLGVKLPAFYVNTMLNYPFSEDSIAVDCMLPQTPELHEEDNGIIPDENKYLAIGTDGGEFLYFIRLNGDENVYIFDAENSNFHHSIEATTWQEYLDKIKKIDLESKDEEAKRLERKRNKKWWQFWI